MLPSNLGKKAAQRQRLPVQPVHLFRKVSGEAVLASIAAPNNVDTPDKIFFGSRLYGHDLKCSEDYEQIVISAPNNQERCKTLLYPNLLSTRDSVTEMLSDFCTRGFYS